MKTVYVLKTPDGLYYIHHDQYGSLNDAQDFIEFEDARQKAQRYYLKVVAVKRGLKVIE